MSSSHSAAKQTTQGFADPTTLLQRVISTKNYQKIVDQLVGYLNGPAYSLVDLFHDASRLKEKIASDGMPVERLVERWTLLDQTLRDCVARTSIPLEKFIETTGHAFCELDKTGTVVFANARMLELDPKCMGQKLATRFGKFAGEVTQELTRKDPGRTGVVCQREFMTDRGQWPVLAEFGRTDTPVGRRSYALLVDMTESVKAERKALDAAPNGMLKIDAERRILYANQKALDLVEFPLRQVVGRDVMEFIIEETNRQQLKEQFADRERGLGAQYTLAFTKPRSKAQVHLRITGIPSYDASGAFNGMLAAVQPIDHEIARQEIARLVATQADFKVLFREIMRIVGRFVQFDCGATFSMFTPDRDYSRLVCRYPNKGPLYRSRWFPTPNSIRQWLDQPRTWTGDVRAWLESMPDCAEILHSTDTQASLADGLTSLISVPIREAGRIVGALSLRSKRPDAYDEQTKYILVDKLCLDQALYAVFNARDRAERDFVASLRSKISASTGDHRELAKTVCREIAAFYDFQSVSIFKINALRGYFSILAQANGRSSPLGLPDDYTQPLDQGVLGLAYRRGERVTVADASAVDGSEETAAFIQVAPKTVSELCVPIKLRGRILWILNLEDSHANAFARPEVETVESITRQLCATIERRYQVLVLEQMIEVFPEAIVITGANGNILTPNKNALRMLGCASPSPSDNLVDFLPAGDWEKVVSDSGERHVTTVRAKDGRSTAVLLSAFTLPEEYDHRVVVLEDFSELQWKGDLERLKAALAEAAGQVRVPLSLVSSYVQEIGACADDATKDLVRKTVRQLNRIELTYDRVLASYDAERLPPERRVPVDFGRIVNHILSELPRLAQGAVNPRIEPGDHVVLADTYRLLFALESMLAYLLRCRSGEDPVCIEVRTAAGKVEVLMSGRVAQPQQLNELANLVEATRADIALGETVLRRIAEDCGGTFERRRQSELYETLALRLPHHGN